MLFDKSQQNNGIESLPEFDHHYSVTFLNDEKSGLKGFIAIHRRNPEFPSFGATRMWKYDSETEALQDALRLSKMMSYKSALAGLKSGGAKGVIILPKRKIINRKKILQAYAQQVDLLKGNFVTGTDVGLDQKDLTILKEKTPYIVGFNDHTTELTAQGIFYSIQATLKEVFGQESVNGKTFSIQGVGKVGEALLTLLTPQAKKIYIADIDKKVLKNIAKKFPKAVIVDPSEIHKKEVDVFSPCALSGAINLKNISGLKCKTIAGGANNQLESDEAGALLHRLGILYCPDYIVNAGGLIAVVHEYEYPEFNFELVRQKVFEIKQRLANIFALSKRKNRPTNIIANNLAKKVFSRYK